MACKQRLISQTVICIKSYQHMIRELCRVGYGCMIVNYRPNELLSENNHCQKIIIVRKIIIVHGTIIRVLHYNVKVTAA